MIDSMGSLTKMVTETREWHYLLDESYLYRLAFPQIRVPRDQCSLAGTWRYIQLLCSKRKDIFFEWFRAQAINDYNIAILKTEGTVSNIRRIGTWTVHHGVWFVVFLDYWNQCFSWDGAAAVKDRVKTQAVCFFDVVHLRSLIFVDKVRFRCSHFDFLIFCRIISSCSRTMLCILAFD